MEPLIITTQLLEYTALPPMFMKASKLLHHLSFGTLLLSQGEGIQNRYLLHLWLPLDVLPCLLPLPYHRVNSVWNVQSIQLKAPMMECELNFPKDEFYMVSKLTAPGKGSGYGSHLRTTATKHKSKGLI